MNVFVYGTLKLTGRFAREFNSVRLSSTEATVEGVLYNIGSFPGANFAEEGVITGEIHDLPDSAINRLDMIEGYYGNNSKHNLYNRLEVYAQPKEEEEAPVKCIAYEFNFGGYSDRKFNKIDSGIWNL